MRFMPPPPPLAPAPTVLATPKGARPPIPATPTGVPAAVTMLTPATAPATAPAAVPVAAAPSGGMAEADLKLLLDMAVASGNQAAVDALLRQAQAAGMSPEQFNALLPQASG